MTRFHTRPGPFNRFTDVPGLLVGQAHDVAAMSGVSLIVPEKPVTMAVDVRGGGPGTRETDALVPHCLVQNFHGLVLSGGSVFGLGAADRLVALLSRDGIGLDLGPRAVPVVPAAILFDLKNGGNKAWGDRPPYARLAEEAYLALKKDVQEGAYGAGFGARAGAKRGGIGTASFITDDGLIASAIVAVNSFGDLSPEAGGPPAQPGQINFPKLGLIGANTTIAAVATNARLDKAGCQRLAIMAQDGMARAIRPIHTPFDGDTVFAIATGEKTLPRDLATSLALLGSMASDALFVAINRAVARANGEAPLFEAAER